VLACFTSYSLTLGVWSSIGDATIELTKEEEEIADEVDVESEEHSE